MTVFESVGLHESPFMPVFAPPSVMFVRGKGTELFDIEGRRYLDFLSGIAVTSLGHAHPVVAEAIATQAHELLHVSNSSPTRRRRRRRWRSTSCSARPPASRARSFFTNSGAEANECALKLARKFGGRGRHVVVSAFGSFHGRTLAALAATGQPAKHEPFSPMPEGFQPRRVGRRRRARGAVDATVGAVLIEPVQGEGGVIPAATRVPRRRSAACATSGAADDRRRDPDRVRSHRGVVRLPARRRRARRGHDGQGDRATACPSAPAGPSARSPRCSSRATTAARTAARRSPRRPCSAVIDEMRRIDAPRLAAERGAYSPSSLARSRRRRASAAAGCCSPPSSTDGRDAKACTPPCSPTGLVANAVTPTALRFAPPLTVSRRGDRRGGRDDRPRCWHESGLRTTRSTVADLTADELVHGARPRRRGADARPCRSTATAWR